MQVRALLLQTSGGRGGASIVDIRRRYGGFEVAGTAVFVSRFLLVAKNKMAGESPGTGDSQLTIRSGTCSSPAD